MKADAKPKCVKARNLPFSLKPKIEQELNSQERDSIISKSNTSKWATPIAPVVKKDGSVRICGDFKVSVNQALDIKKYPLPKIEDHLSYGQKFSKLHLCQAYLQL